jgi:hypothetical protein
MAAKAAEIDRIYVVHQRFPCEPGEILGVAASKEQLADVLMSVTPHRSSVYVQVWWLPLNSPPMWELESDSY